MAGTLSLSSKFSGYCRFALANFMFHVAVGPGHGRLPRSNRSLTYDAWTREHPLILAVRKCMRHTISTHIFQDGAWPDFTICTSIECACVQVLVFDHASPPPPPMQKNKNQFLKLVKSQYLDVENHNFDVDMYMHVRWVESCIPVLTVVLFPSLYFSMKVSVLIVFHTWTGVHLEFFVVALFGGI